MPLAAQLGKEALVEFAGVEVVIVDLDTRVGGLKILEQRFNNLSVRGGVQYHRVACRGWLASQHAKVEYKTCRGKLPGQPMNEVLCGI